MTERLEGAPVASAILAGLSGRLNAGITQKRWPAPTLVSVQVSATSPFSVYLRNQARIAAQVGIQFETTVLSPDVTATSLARRLAALEEDETVDAVLLEHPLPGHLDYEGAVSHLSAEKDVDGVSPLNLGLLFAGRPIQVPAVARAAIAIVRHYAVPLAGARVAVVGRSASVGLPLARLLLGRGADADATVVIAHSRTPDLASALSGSDVIFSCAGQPHLLTRENVPKDCTIVDIGLSAVPDPTRPSGVRSVGDADAASLDGWAARVTPVPGGVGPVTVAELMGNVVWAWESRRAGSTP
jgi:methylenetetrahydrofolate dehydrogenase (NADP+)/methenyltetrahydrofolate cyclohydrolase